MPITIALIAVPAKFICEDGSEGKTLVIHPFGRKYGLTVYSVNDVQGIADAVARFAHRVHAQFPDDSFSVTVRVRSGDRPPKGFAQALRSGALGQHRFTTSSEHGSLGPNTAG